ncbi:hypothetical protein, partial [Sharpea azabuensis]|uniref:hypothetical protein n=1 Tax=Sharpea azabuensis TaxID=322505 RepID=UPI002E8131A6
AIAKKKKILLTRKNRERNQTNEGRTETKRNRGHILKKTQRIREGSIENVPKIAQPALQHKIKIWIYESIQTTSNDERVTRSISWHIQDILL